MDELRDPRKFLSWVTRIAINYGYQKTKLDRLRYNALPPDDLLGYALLFSPQEIPDSDMAYTIRRWILRQKESDQELFLLKHYRRMTFLAISRKTKMPLSTVKRRLAQMAEKLKAVLEKEINGE